MVLATKVATSSEFFWGFQGSRIFGLSVSSGFGVSRALVYWARQGFGSRTALEALGSCGCTFYGAGHGDCGLLGLGCGTQLGASGRGAVYGDIGFRGLQVSGEKKWRQHGSLYCRRCRPVNPKILKALNPKSIPNRLITGYCFWS